eukprot:88065-Chlamydomonas_euryale.AAC.2
MDTDSNGMISLEEFLGALKSNEATHKNVQGQGSQKMLQQEQQPQKFHKQLPGLLPRPRWSAATPRALYNPPTRCHSTNATQTHTALQAGQDENGLMEALGAYLADNKEVLRQYFAQADADRNGAQQPAGRREGRGRSQCKTFLGCAWWVSASTNKWRLLSNTSDAGVGWRKSRCGVEEKQVWGGGEAGVGWRSSRCGAQEKQVWGGGEAGVGRRSS